MKGIKYQFKAIIWQYSPPEGWHFISLPVSMAKEIRGLLKREEQGWGRLKAVARIGGTEWKTAIWFDTKMNTYLLPLKTEVRKNESLIKGKKILAELWV